MGQQCTFQQKRKTIAIVGGGVSGTLTAYYLERERSNARILLIDPAPSAGLGLAYSTPSLRHLLNVSAGKMSASPDEPDHFLRWLRANYDPDATPKSFAPRAVFGRYVQSIIAKLTYVERVRAYVVDCRLAGSGATLTLAGGRCIQADLVVIATGNFDPSPLPGVSKEVEETGAYCPNAWRTETYKRLAEDAPVTLIGTGLSGVDVILRLRELGHRGVITAVSLQGLFPNRHAQYRQLDKPVISAGTPPTCLSYLRTLRSAIRDGAEWRAAVDSLRSVTNDLWLALPVKEQQRFRRHLQRRWNVVRHRMAPQIAGNIESELAAGTLVVRAGHLHSIESAPTGAAVTIRTPTGIKRFTTARAINCTGPCLNYRRVDSLLLKSLFQQGLAMSGPLGAGFNTTLSGAVIAVDGTSSNVLFNVGPGRQGTLLESIAVPEIREQAAAMAKLLNTSELQSAPAVAA
ncbi:MAG TPA: FAD/NAD(P)-binding protein [Bryobacteraceae bacterium]|jgi:hydroxyacylglutathione hydrolase|nr:FAD/NAD(P)-binding protein [Bryobacteraceae bacterium]